MTVVQSRSILDKLSEAAIKRWEDKAEVKTIIAPGITVKELQGMTGANLIIADNLIKMDVLD